MLQITKDTFSAEVEQASTLVVIDFYADWCGPCRMIAPTLSELEKEHPDVKFCKVNVDNEPDLARMFNIQSIPFVAFVKNNTFLDMSVGYVQKEKLEKIIAENK